MWGPQKKNVCGDEAFNDRKCSNSEVFVVFYFKTLTVNSACYLANGDYIRYLLEKLVRENSDRGGEEVEMFSVLIEIVEGAL